MLFYDRVAAGGLLARRLVAFRAENPVVLGLARGGVPVGFEVAKKLRAPLDVLVVRKIGAPGNPEFGVGAIAEGDVKILDREAVESLGLSSEDLGGVVARKKAEVAQRVKMYRGKRALPKLAGKIVILVDDGLATGITAWAAIQYVIGLHPVKIVVAAPVCSPEAAQAVRGVLRPTDELIYLAAPEEFSSVGQWYQNFGQVTDEEVIDYLRRAART